MTRRKRGGAGDDQQAGRRLPGCRQRRAPPAAIPATAAVPATSSLLDSLSPRERDILRGIARGASNKEIGRELGIAETTVKIHVQHVLRKLEVSSRVQAAVLATENGLT